MRCTHNFHRVIPRMGASPPSTVNTGKKRSKKSMNNRIVTSLCVLCALLSAIQGASAQGPLSPPGAPAPTMRTLQQVEPRTPITNATAVTISTPGSYYLTTNISVTSGTAITITASQVTLDLNGFTLSST
jgi:hypothetical protein